MPDEAADVVVTLTGDSFDDEVTGSDLPWLVDFWAPWCAPCLVLEPVLAEVAAELDGRLRVGRLDTAAHPEVARRFQVSSVPTLLVFDRGAVTRRLFDTRKRILLAALEDELRPA